MADQDKKHEQPRRAEAEAETARPMPLREARQPDGASYPLDAHRAAANAGRYGAAVRAEHVAGAVAAAYGRKRTDFTAEEIEQALEAYAKKGVE